MKEIQLTKGQVALVDDEDFDWLSKHKWFAVWSVTANSFYAYRNIKKSNSHISMHREILKSPKGLMCDHINHNTLDNRKSNLRNVTNSQNQLNRRGAQSNNKIGERCIRFRGGSFQVRVFVEGKYVYDKSFRDLSVAICERDKILQKYVVLS